MVRVTGSDLATSAKPTAYEHADADTGGFGNTSPGSNEGKLTLPPGTYALFAKIVAIPLSLSGDVLANVYLEVAGAMRPAYSRTGAVRRLRFRAWMPCPRAAT